MSPYNGWYDSNAGSGSEDLGAAENPTKVRDVGDHTAKPDSGALEAWGGLNSAIKIEREKYSEPSIDRDGYPMEGEAASSSRHGVHGSMAGDNSAPMKERGLTRDHRNSGPMEEND